MASSTTLVAIQICPELGCKCFGSMYYS